MLQGLSQSHVPAYRGHPRMQTDIEYQIKYASYSDTQREMLIFQLPA